MHVNFKRMLWASGIAGGALLLAAGTAGAGQPYQNGYGNQCHHTPPTPWARGRGSDFGQHPKRDQQFQRHRHLGGQRQQHGHRLDNRWPEW